MVSRGDFVGQDADAYFIRNTLPSTPNTPITLAVCQQECLNAANCLSMNYVGGFCYLYNKPTTLNPNGNSDYFDKVCRNDQGKYKLLFHFMNIDD